MHQPPTEGEFQTLELLWKHVHNAARVQGYVVSTLRSNMTHNQIEIGRDRKYAKRTTWTLEVKNPEHSHDANQNIMAHPAFRKFNEQETPKISQMFESLLMPKKIQAQLFSKRESDRPLILQEIYSQVKKRNKDKLQGRRPIDSLIDTSKKKILFGPLQGMLRDTLPPCFSLTPLP
ncbi:hypothetical protein O181_045631 [Austropuccinia psidii MF-1]|uniref:Uncharacterized protein n=1 Tax=Austropuccinia psidii MF-1 TaxID=1389203 RepID=A0A9Q3HHX6_9BASI|nr:hypothetical protein [Austropuccinia psidii MF-1]